MTKGARESKWSRVTRFLLTQGPMAALLIGLAIFSLGTFGNYVAADDLEWVTRTISDATRPWHVFSSSDPLFGNYYRPMAHLAWLFNYYLWGFNFDGHQAMFIILWLAVVWLTYQVGRRIAGRTAGFIAAAVVGFNDIYLMISGWKSWYTTVTELAAVLAWAIFYLDWLKSRTRGKLLAWLICAAVATLSRELGPLVISAGVLVTLILPALFGREKTGWRRRFSPAVLWLLVTVAVLAAMPSYRESIKKLLHVGAGGPVVIAPGERAAAMASATVGPAWSNVADRFRTHSGSMLFYGISRYLLYLAALLPAMAWLRRWAGQKAPRRGQVALLGALAIGAVFLAIPANAMVLGPQAWEAVRSFALPLTHGVLLAFVLVVAFAGDREDRLLGAWFVAAFAPILFLPRASNAYHMLAFIALALFAGKHVAPLLQECRRRLTSGGPHKDGKESWYALAVAVALILSGQAVMLVNGTRTAWKEVRLRVKMGSAMREQVDLTVAVVAFSVREGRVFVADDAYSVLAGQMLHANYSFQVISLERPGSRMVGLRLFDVPLRLYSHAIAYDDELFQRYNHPLLRAGAGFEDLPLGGNVVGGGRTGSRAMATPAAGAEAMKAQTPSSEFMLPPGAYVFGGFARIEAQEARSVTMALVEQGAGEETPLLRHTPQAAQGRPEWELLWEDAATPRQGRFVFRVLDVEGLRNGRVLVDDIFLCPVAALIAELQRKPEGPETPSETETPAATPGETKTQGAGNTGAMEM